MLIGSRRYTLMQPKIHISFSPQKTVSIYAMFYLETEADIYGWCGAGGGDRFSGAFFMVENFYATRATVLHRSVLGDVYGAWVADYPRNRDGDRCPVPEAMLHELERIQSEFMQEWLFFKNDPDTSSELALYRTKELPINALNVRFHRLGRFIKREPTWSYASAGADLNVIEFLQRHLRCKDPASGL